MSLCVFHVLKDFIRSFGSLSGDQNYFLIYMKLEADSSCILPHINPYYIIKHNLTTLGKNLTEQIFTYTVEQRFSGLLRIPYELQVCNLPKLSHYCQQECTNLNWQMTPRRYYLLDTGRQMCIRTHSTTVYAYAKPNFILERGIGLYVLPLAAELLRTIRY